MKNLATRYVWHFHRNYLP